MQKDTGWLAGGIFPVQINTITLKPGSPIRAFWQRGKSGNFTILELFKNVPFLLLNWRRVQCFRKEPSFLVKNHLFAWWNFSYSNHPVRAGLKPQAINMRYTTIFETLYHTNKHHHLEARLTNKSTLAKRKKVQILPYYKFPKMVHLCLWIEENSMF